MFVVCRSIADKQAIMTENCIVQKCVGPHISKQYSSIKELKGNSDSHTPNSYFVFIIAATRGCVVSLSLSPLAVERITK